MGVQQRVRLLAVLVQGLELQPLQARVAELDLKPQTLQVQVQSPDLPP